MCVVPCMPSSGRSLSFPCMRAHAKYPQSNNTVVEDISPPPLLLAPGAPMPPRSNPPSSVTSLLSWEMNTMQGACALTKLSRVTHPKQQERRCTTISKIVSDDQTKQYPRTNFQMHTTSESFAQKIKAMPSKTAPPTIENSLSSVDEAATLVHPQLPSPTLSHDDVILSLDTIQYDTSEDLIQAWLAAATTTDNKQSSMFPPL